MSHLEDLLAEWYDWRGYVVRRNIRVSPLKHGGHAGELDIVAYHPQTHELLHVEPSLDAQPWATREKRYKNKFDLGKRHIRKEVLPWISPTTRLRQIAVLYGPGKNRKTLAGGEVIAIDKILQQITDDIIRHGKIGKAAIPEQYRLLRTIQLVLLGTAGKRKTKGDAR